MRSERIELLMPASLRVGIESAAAHDGAESAACWLRMMALSAARGGRPRLAEPRSGPMAARLLMRVTAAERAALMASADGAGGISEWLRAVAETALSGPRDFLPKK